MTPGERRIRVCGALLAYAVLGLVFAVAAVTIGPAFVAYTTIADDDHFPHPGEFLGVMLGAVSWYTTTALVSWALLTGRDWTGALQTGLVMLGVSALLLLWAWNDYRLRRKRSRSKEGG